MHNAGYEEEQLVEWGLAHLAQKPSGQVDVGLRAKQEPFDLHRAESEQNDPLLPPPGKAGRSVPVQSAASWVSHASRRRSFELEMAVLLAAPLCLGSCARRPGGLQRDL